MRVDLCLDLDTLPAAARSHKLTLNTDGGSWMEIQDILLVVLQDGWRNDLDIREARAIIQLNEREASF
jgi:hypothetical protein